MAVSVVLALALALATGARAAPLTISVDESSAGPAVPQDFLGLSYEVRSLSQIAGYARQGNFVPLMRSLGHGVMRFGGVTADSQTAWAAPGRARPTWANSTVTPDDFANLATLVRAAGWRTLLSVNLAHYDPDAAAHEVATAQTDLGDSLAGIEIGNEANAYAKHGLRDDPWGFDQYRQDVDNYRAAIDAQAPGVPLAGPDASSGHIDWLSEEAVSERPALLTAHFYSLGCHGSVPAEIAELFSPMIRGRLAYFMTHFGRVSLLNQIPLRITETNNVSCGGRGGVSNSMASALWATDLMVQAMHAGIAGVNFHGSLSNCRGYSPLCTLTPADADSGRMHAQPEWYALLLARRLIGDRPLRSSVRNPRPKVTIEAFAAPGGRLQFVIVNELAHHNRPLPVLLHVPARLRSGTILRLSARLPSSTDGVKLGGRLVRSDGTWRPQPNVPRVSGKPGALTLMVPAGTAALVTLK